MVATHEQIEMNKAVINVPPFKKTKLTKTFKKMVKLASEFNLPTPTMSKIGIKKYFEVTTSTSTMFYEVLPKFKSNSALSISELVCDVYEIEYPSFFTPEQEWTILGVFDFTNRKIKSAPGKMVPKKIAESVDLQSFTTHCDHCQKSIQRNKTVVVQNIDTEEIKIVGGQCTTHYLGKNFERVISYLDSLDTFENMGFDYDNDREFFGPSQICVSLSDIIKYYTWYSNKNGHLTKKGADARNEGDKSVLSTSQNVVYDFALLKQNCKEDASVISEFINNLSVARTEISDDVVIDFRNFINDKYANSYNSFIHNVKNLLEEDSVLENDIHTITSAMSFYTAIKLTEIERAKKEEVTSNSKHIGIIGEKTAFKLTVVSTRYIDSGFGISTIYNMVDSLGNIIVKFGTINARFVVNKDVESGYVVKEGDVLEFTADIKGHNDFRGTKQTNIGRVSKYNAKLDYIK